MDFKQIEAFINVAKHKNFSKAAKSMFLSQPTVSAHVINLEKELNVKLFDRTSKMVELTTEGEAFLEYALEMVNVKNSAFTAINQMDSQIQGNLEIKTSSTPNASLVPELVTKYHRLYPEVRLTISEEDSATIVADILNAKVELGFVGSIQSDDKIKTFETYDDELVIVSHYKMNLPDVITLDDLLLFPFILRKEGSATQKVFEEVLHKNNIETSKVNGVIRCDHISTLIQLVKRNIGVAVISQEVFNELDLGYVLHASTVDNCAMNRTIYLIGHANRTLSPQAKKFIDLTQGESNER